MKLIAVCDNELYMFAEKETSEVKENDKCIVYDTRRKTYAPSLCVGSWTARIGGWELPTKEQMQMAKSFVPKG